MSLTLNDFRSVLGKVNDGDVVMKTDRSGIEKADAPESPGPENTSFGPSGFMQV